MRRGAGGGCRSVSHCSWVVSSSSSVKSQPGMRSGSGGVSLLEVIYVVLKRPLVLGRGGGPAFSQ